MITAAIVFAWICIFFIAFSEKNDYSYYASLLLVPALIYIVAWIAIS